MVYGKRIPFLPLRTRAGPENGNAGRFARILPPSHAGRTLPVVQEKISAARARIKDAAENTTGEVLPAYRPKEKAVEAAWVEGLEDRMISGQLSTYQGKTGLKATGLV
jgi:hypothetical protein